MKISKSVIIVMLITIVATAKTIMILSTNATNKDSSSSKTVLEYKENDLNYPVNELGQTYGSNYYGSIKEPDLILVEGEDGVVGYAKRCDFFPDVSSPEEAIAYSNSIKNVGYQSIPIYKEDGITVVGEFRLYYPYEN